MKIEELPNEILEEILSRLPSKCLLNCSIVSKPWLDLITNHNFIKLHLKKSLQTKRNLTLFQFQKNFDVFELDLDSHHDEDVLQPVKIDYNPMIFSNYRLKPITSSCDGLHCMPIDYYKVFLWNSSIRKSIKLPYTPIDMPDKCSFFLTYQLGYDNTNNDYKVVRFTRSFATRDVDVKYEFKIYSLRSNSWHTPEKVPPCPPDASRFGFQDSIVNGALHLISDVKSDLKESLIIAFDLATEKCRVLPQPKYSGRYNYLYLTNLEGCLSLSCHYDGGSTVDVFLLKEYGGKNEYWSRLITMVDFNIDAPLKPITYSNSGKNVLLEMGYKSLVLYNLEEKSIEKIKVNGSGKFVPCIESLVPLDVIEARNETAAGDNCREPIIVEETDEIDALD